jgi:hypothetical protein
MRDVGCALAVRLLCDRTAGALQAQSGACMAPTPQGVGHAPARRGFSGVFWGALASALYGVWGAGARRKGPALGPRWGGWGLGSLA